MDACFGFAVSVILLLAIKYDEWRRKKNGNPLTGEIDRDDTAW
jgi:hypothetical protein